jgi:hypothetical protein
MLSKKAKVRTRLNRERITPILALTRNRLTYG